MNCHSEFLAKIAREKAQLKALTLRLIYIRNCES